MTLIHDRHNRGASKIGWLDSKHTFSFGDFYDPARMGFSHLRVINEDHVIPGAGFQPHGHRDMEILTYVVSGALAHKDSLGNGSVIRPGDVQIMSAGSGIRHSEMNASPTEPVHFFQIWIEPNERDIAPGYQQISLPDKAGRVNFHTIAGPDAGPETVKINQDAHVLMARPSEGGKLATSVQAGRIGFLQVIKGKISLEGTVLHGGDGFEFEGGQPMAIEAVTDAEIIVFDLAMSE